MTSEGVNSGYSFAAINTLAQHWHQHFGSALDCSLAMAPGRVNLLGDHTDYNQGLVLPMTLDRGIYCAMRRRTDNRVNLYSLNLQQALGYESGSPPEFPTGHWGNYVIGVLEELRRKAHLTQGVEGLVYGDLPMGAGISSSAALEVSLAVSLQQLFGFPMDALEMIKLCQHVEHHYVGLQCGIMDQYVSRLGRRGNALMIDCRSLESHDVPLDLGEFQLLVVHSGVQRSLARSPYNERRAECDRATRFFAQSNPGIASLRDVTETMLKDDAVGLPESVLHRCLHVVSENQRVRTGGELLATGDLRAFGQLMNQSHDSLRDFYSVSCAELDALVGIAQGSEGVAGARMTGAGFGGCMVCMVHTEAIAGLEDKILRNYAQQFTLEPTFLRVSSNYEAGPIEGSILWPVQRQNAS